MTILIAINPKRKLQDVEIKGWPIVISEGIVLGAIAVHAKHELSVTGRNEVHIAQRSYDDLTILLGNWSILESQVELIKKEEKFRIHER